MMTDYLNFEQDLLSQLLERLRRFGLWVLVIAVAVGVLTAFYVQRQPVNTVTKASFTLADVRVKSLAAVYDTLPANTPLLLGALEIDELSRFAALLQLPPVWHAMYAQPELCQSNAAWCAGADVERAEQLRRQHQSMFQVEHRRRGNLLQVQWRSTDPELGRTLLPALLRSAEEYYRQQAVLQLTQQGDDLQQALTQASSVGERSELTRQLDKVLAERHIWQAGPPRVLHPIAAMHQQQLRHKSVILGAIAACFAALISLICLLFFPRR